MSLPSKNFHLNRSLHQVVTETRIRKEREQAKVLALDLERFAMTLKCSGEGVIATDTNGVITIFNSIAEELTGWKAQEALNRPVDLVYQTFDAKGNSRNSSVGHVLKSKVTSFTADQYLLRKDGTKRFVEENCRLLEDKGKILGAVLVLRDVPEQQKLVQEMFHTSKLESLGLVTTGIAHDFSNLLTVVLGNLSLARNYANDPNLINSALEEAETAVLRARDLTWQLMAFAKEVALVRKEVKLNRLIKEVVKLISHNFTTECKLNIAPNLWNIEGNEIQIGQVVQNLVINAIQAMNGTGKLLISAENIYLNPSNSFSLPGGKYIKIAVKDFGKGIAPEIINRIFEPFFTTKENGTGIGLATCLKVVKQHNGHIEVTSSLGVGTTFEVYLPALKIHNIKLEAVAPQTPLTT
jgi:PAS domain S-box-containing protein